MLALLKEIEFNESLTEEKKQKMKTIMKCCIENPKYRETCYALIGLDDKGFICLELLLSTYEPSFP